MKKFLFIALALCIGFTAWGQSSKKNNKNQAKEKKEAKSKDAADDDDTVDQDGGADKPKTKTKTKAKEPEKKTTKGKTPEKKPTTGKTSGKNQPEQVTVLNYYYELPLESLPHIDAYIKQRKQEAPLVKTVDNKDLRKGFILNQDLDRGFLNLQLSGEGRYTRIQQLKTTGKPLVAIEVSDCRPHCQNELKIYRKDSVWTDVTSEYLPQIDLKWVRKRLQEKYKAEYLDLDLYESRGYEDDATLLKALMYTVSIDDNIIIVKEQHLPFNLYQFTWEEEKNRFNVKKL